MSSLFRFKKPWLISGPCGAESEEQVDEIFRVFQKGPVSLIRAGVWKPRSKPGNFEGRGEEALRWLQKAAKKYQMPFCTEVANTEQIELALKYEVAAVWIGARSTVNPFLVQQLADTLRGVRIPVMIKNPVNPDIELWSGALERFRAVGIQDLLAIHRGFSSYDPGSNYRNKPIWSIPIELKRRFQEVPLFCDVSHICGRRDLIASTAQRALDLDFDGLMIESHPDPDQALSDAAQQITPDVVLKLWNNLQIRKPANDRDVQQQIEEIRAVVDTMDAEIMGIVARRLERVKQLGLIKDKHNMPIYQADRWREIVETRTQWGRSQDLEADFVLALFTLIHDQSIKTQMETIRLSQPE